MLRKRKGKTYTAEQAASKDFISDVVKSDEAYRSALEPVVNSSAYFDSEKKKVMAMIRQLGNPAIFLTLSPCEKDWKELHIVLKEAAKNSPLTEQEREDVAKMDNVEIADLIRSDPVTCARYIHHRFLSMMKAIKHPNGVFASNPITDYYYRVEYQQRGELCA